MKRYRHKKVVPYNKIIFYGKRLLIRPYRLTDFNELQRSHIGRLEAQNKYDEPIPSAKESDYKKFKSRVNRQRENGKKRYHFIFGVYEKKTGTYVGQIDLFTINHELEWANIGYHIQNQYFRNGYATEATKLGLCVAFNQLKFHRVEAAMELDNKASKKVAEKAGLIFEGKRRKFFSEDGGIDMNIYGINAIDFNESSSQT